MDLPVAIRNLAPDSRVHYIGVERRRAPRIETPFPATVRGVDANGQAFEEYTVLDNLSASGLYLRLMHDVALGARLFVFVRLSGASTQATPAAYIALRSLVLRVEPRTGGVFGLAVRLTHHRFIYLATL